MRMLLPLIVAATVSLAVLTPAHAQEVKKKDFSGWLQSYDNLVYIEDRNAFLFFNEERRGTYEAVLVGEVTVFGSNVQKDNEMATQASDYMREGIVRLFKEEGVLAQEPGPNVAELSIAITGAEKAIESMKARDVIPVAAVFRGAKAATGNLKSYIDVMFEGEAVDSVSGEQIMAIVTRDYGDTSKRSGDDFEFEDLVPTLDRWLDQYRETLRAYLAKND